MYSHNVTLDNYHFKINYNQMEPLAMDNDISLKSIYEYLVNKNLENVGTTRQ